MVGSEVLTPYHGALVKDTYTYKRPVKQYIFKKTKHTLNTLTWKWRISISSSHFSAVTCSVCSIHKKVSFSDTKSKYESCAEI